MDVSHWTWGGLLLTFVLATSPVWGLLLMGWILGPVNYVKKQREDDKKKYRW